MRACQCSYTSQYKTSCATKCYIVVMPIQLADTQDTSAYLLFQRGFSGSGGRDGVGDELGGGRGGGEEERESTGRVEERRGLLLEAVEVGGRSM